MALALLHKCRMKSGAALAIAVLLVFPAVASARSIGDRCPAYTAQLLRARDSLSDGDRYAAIAALRNAQAALGECLRREGDEAGERVMLAASSLLSPRGGALVAQSF